MSLLKESLESIESLSILYLEEVDAVEAHEAGADAHQEEAGRQENEVDDHVHVAPAVRAGKHVGVLHDGGLKGEELHQTWTASSVRVLLCLRAVRCYRGPA